MASFLLDAVDIPPGGIPLLVGSDANRFWVLSHPAGWRLALGQNSAAGQPPEVLVGASGAVFVGLYAGRALALEAGTGRVLGDADMSGSGLVFWHECGGVVLADGETRLAAFSPAGALLWTADTADVVTELKAEGGAIEARDMSGKVYRFDAATGKLLPI